MTTANAIEIGLNAAIVAVEGKNPRLLVVSDDSGAPDALPFGPFDPLQHRTLDMSLRATVVAQTALRMGYIEQLYTFGDRGRSKMPGDEGPHVVSVGYLALTRMEDGRRPPLSSESVHWRDWYGFLPWEDWRGGRPPQIDEVILPALARWAEEASSSLETDLTRPSRRARIKLAFGLDDFPFDEERVLERYELLYEAGLVQESFIDSGTTPPPHQGLGIAMRYDHRRIAATALARLRGKIKYRPVVFELMAEEFTLTELQATVEAISGRHLHKQNFRRLVEGAELVEPTGVTKAATGGRPAALFRFRRQIVEERPAPGLKVGGR